MTGHLPADAPHSARVVEGFDPRDQPTTGLARPVFFVRFGETFHAEHVYQLDGVEVPQ